MDHMIRWFRCNHLCLCLWHRGSLQGRTWKADMTGVDRFWGVPSGICALLLGLVATPPLCAQHYNFQSYGPEHGLNNSSVVCLFQDTAGFLWVGTQNGLFRY